MNLIPFKSVVQHFASVDALLIEQGETILEDVKKLIEDVDGSVTLYNSNMGIRKYELVVVNGYEADIKLLKEIYHSLENSGQLLFTLDLQADKYHVKELVEEANFVAVNDIELDNFCVVIAKKMHGWGGGM